MLNSLVGLQVTRKAIIDISDREFVIVVIIPISLTPDTKITLYINYVHPEINESAKVGHKLKCLHVIGMKTREKEEK